MTFQYKDFLEEPVNQLHHHFNSVESDCEDAKDFFKIESSDVAFVYFDELFAKSVKKMLSSFSYHFHNISFIDAGSFKMPQIQSFIKVLQAFQEQGINVVVLDFPHQSLNFSSAVDIDLFNTGTVIVSNKYLFPFGIKPEYNTLLGFQRHLIDQSVLYEMDVESHQSASLGMISRHPNIIEPILRNAQWLICHLDSLKGSEIGQFEENLPTGLTSESICQYARVCGSSRQSKGFLLTLTEQQKKAGGTPAILAEMIWYFLEGFSHKKNQLPQWLEQVVITTKENDIPLIFALDNEHKWWVKVESESNDKFQACSEEEYECTLRGDVPSRLFRLLFIKH